MSIFLIIWNTVTLNTTLPIKQVHSRTFSRWYASKLAFYSESSGFLWNCQARWCVHTGCNMRFMGVLDLCLWTFTENWPCFLRTCLTCSLECLCKCYQSQRKKWAERQDSSGETQVWLSFMWVMRGLFLYPVSKHTCWGLWQCTLNSAISFPTDTS